MTYAEKIKQQQKDKLTCLVSYFGGQSQLASEMGVSSQAVFNWIARGRISAKCAIVAEIKTGGDFKREDLRPDVISWENKEQN